MTTHPTSPLRVLVVARQPMVRVGLRGLLVERPDVVVVGQASTVEEAAQRSAELAPEVVVYAWDGEHIDEVAALVDSGASTRTPVVLLGDVPPSGELALLLRAGVQGYVLSDAAPEALGAALHAVAEGLLVLDSLLGRAMAAATPTIDPTSDEPLTERELQVLQLLAAGLPNKSIANRLGISEHTVKFHVGSILAKLNAASRTEAVTRAARRGLLTL